jgi:hypothetical protein
MNRGCTGRAANTAVARREAGWSTSVYDPSIQNAEARRGILLIDYTLSPMNSRMYMG